MIPQRPLRVTLTTRHFKINQMCVIAAKSEATTMINTAHRLLTVYSWIG